jgi:outer membrane usher protein FimD/PapC
MPIDSDTFYVEGGRGLVSYSINLDAVDFADGTATVEVSAERNTDRIADPSGTWVLLVNGSEVDSQSDRGSWFQKELSLSGPAGNGDTVTVQFSSQFHDGEASVSGVVEVEPSESDLSVSCSVSQSDIVAGDQSTVSASVTNSGPVGAAVVREGHRRRPAVGR